MSSDENKGIGPDGEPIRRRGDRRTRHNAVPDDRRKNDRRDIPGIGELIRALFRRGSSSDS